MDVLEDLMMCYCVLTHSICVTDRQTDGTAQAMHC